MPRKRNNRRRRRGGLGRLLRPLSVVLAAVAVVAALTLFFKVDHVEVSGNSRYSTEEIIAVTGVEQGDNLVLLNKFGIKQKLFSELPYLSEVRINPKLPDVLLVEVTETWATASIQGAGGYWLMNASGKLLELVEAEKAQDYLAIIGLTAEAPQIGHAAVLPEDSPISQERLVELLSALEQREMLTRADNLDFSDHRILVLNYDGRFRVEMYYDANFDYKLLCLLEAVARLEPNQKGTIRMTMENNEVHFYDPDAQ